MTIYISVTKLPNRKSWALIRTEGNVGEIFAYFRSARLAMLFKRDMMKLAKKDCIK